MFSTPYSVPANTNSLVDWQKDFEVLSECLPVDSDNVAPDGMYTPCSCQPTSEGADICVDEKCVNFAMQVECKKRECGPTCKNQRFQSLYQEELRVVHFEKKGYGLVTCNDLGNKQFLGEYTGEIVSEKELNR